MAAVMSLKKFVTTCTVTFKTFNFSVVVTKSKAQMWHFSATNATQEKSYVVMCVPKIANGRSLIKLALKKVPAGKKLVIICDKYNDDDLSEGSSVGYTLVTLKEINQYGIQMIEAQERESSAKSA